MSRILQGLYYSPDHLWVRVAGDVAYVGITDYGQSMLDAVIYAIGGRVGAEVEQEDYVANLESVKANCDLFTPIGGRVIAVNETLPANPAAINADPYGQFLFALHMGDPSELDELLDADGYAALLARQGGHE